MSAIRKLHLHAILQVEFPVSPQLSVEQVKEPELVCEAGCEVVAERVEGDAQKGSLTLGSLPTQLELPRQHTLVVLVVPNSDRTVLVATSHDQRPLSANVHATHAPVVESVVNVVIFHVLLEYHFPLDFQSLSV